MKLQTLTPDDQKRINAMAFKLARESTNALCGNNQVVSEFNHGQIKVPDNPKSPKILDLPVQ